MILSLGLFWAPLLSPLHAAPQLLPGVYGYGLDRAHNPAGFGPTSTVIHVTNLHDSGPGSLRAAAAAQGSRVVVFDVSGVIDLQSALLIPNDNITIAGQTAPSPGIALHGASLSIRASNVLIQHIRVRPGDGWASTHATNTTTNRDAINIGAGRETSVSNIVIDHCTFAWSLDEMAECYYDYGNITFNRCIFAEPLSNSIHIDENTFDIDPSSDGNQNYPWQAEDLARTLHDVPNTAARPSRLAVDGSYHQVGVRAEGGYIEYTVPLVPIDRARHNEHLVIVGITGPDRARFTAEVRDDHDKLLLSGVETVDQYAAIATQHTHVFQQANLEGFVIPARTASLKVRLIASGRNAASTGWTLGVDQISLSQGHGMGPFFSDGRTGAGRLAIIGSIIAHIASRGPWVASKQLLFANNVLYDRLQHFMMLGSPQWDGPIHAAIIGNTFIEGSSWPLWARKISPITKIYIPAGSEIFIPDSSTPALENRYDNAIQQPPSFAAAGLPLRATDPTAKTEGMRGFAPVSASKAFAAALRSAGARPADRDAFEKRIVHEIAVGAATRDLQDRPGKLKNSVAEAGGWPTYTQNTASWTLPSNPNADDDGNGYTNIEDWLHDLATQVEAGITPSS